MSTLGGRASTAPSQILCSASRRVSGGLTPLPGRPIRPWRFPEPRLEPTGEMGNTPEADAVGDLADVGIGLPEPQGGLLQSMIEDDLER